MELGIIFTKVLASATVLGNVAFVALVLVRFFLRDQFEHIAGLSARFALPLSSLIAAGATIGSIIYSEVVGFPACILCWMQRIFMYPQMFIAPLAWIRKDQNIFPYMLLLSVIGGGIGLYQWVKDMLSVYAGLHIPCPAVSSLPSCDRLYVFEFNYVTIPMIALNAFIWLGLIAWFAIRKNKHA